MQGGNVTRPLVDVVIPTAEWGNRPRGLLSDLAEELSPFRQDVGEVLVADGEGVYFARAEVLDQGSTIRVSSSSELNGPAINRNKALEHATADYIVFLDDDVRLQPGWGERLLRVLSNGREFDLLGGGIAARNESNWFSQAAEDFVIRHKRQPDGWYLAAAHLVARRAALEELGGFDASFVYGGEDWDLCKRAHLQALSVAVDDSLKVIHEHPTTWSQLMRKADQYGPAEVGLNVYSEASDVATSVEEQRPSPELGPTVRTVGRAVRWPILQYSEFRQMGRSRVRSVRSTALYVPWMARYLRGRRATAADR